MKEVRFLDSCLRRNDRAVREWPLTCSDDTERVPTRLEGCGFAVRMARDDRRRPGVWHIPGSRLSPG